MRQHINKGLLKSLKKEMKNTSSKASFAAIHKNLNSTQVHCCSVT